MPSLVNVPVNRGAQRPAAVVVRVKMVMGLSLCSLAFAVAAAAILNHLFVDIGHS